MKCTNKERDTINERQKDGKMETDKERQTKRDTKRTVKQKEREKEVQRIPESYKRKTAKHSKMER
jgi:hypothetical protein